MAALTTIVAASAVAGTDMTAGLVSAGGSGDTFVADPEVWFRVKNGNASPTNVTVTPPAGGGPRGTTVAPIVYGPVAATTGDRMFGPFPPNPYADQSGNVNVTYSVSATVTVAPYKFSG